jgi:hypothetical protein
LAYDKGGDRFFSGDRDGRILSFDINTARNKPFSGTRHASKILGFFFISFVIIMK